MYVSKQVRVAARLALPRLAQMPRDSAERWMLETGLVRERNRVTDALTDARALIDDALAAVGAPKK